MTEDIVPASTYVHLPVSRELVKAIDEYGAKLSARSRVPVSRTAAVRETRTLLRALSILPYASIAFTSSRDTGRWTYVDAGKMVSSVIAL